VNDRGAAEVVCPNCSSSYPAQERFCPVCNLPLVHPDAAAGEETASESHRRARKIKPQLTEGELVRVAGARNQAEAEFIQGLLLEEGVPSLLRRTAGFDVPDFLAAGPRDILVPQSGVEVARQVLLEADLAPADPSERRASSPITLLVGLVGALVVGAGIIWVAVELLR
jgi:hypothetical protein